MRPAARRLLLGTACTVLAVCVTACKREERASTPLPTRQSTIDPVTKKLDAADADAQKRREALDAASNK